MLCPISERENVRSCTGGRDHGIDCFAIRGISRGADGDLSQKWECEEGLLEERRAMKEALTEYSYL